MRKYKLQKSGIEKLNYNILTAQGLNKKFNIKLYFSTGLSFVGMYALQRYKGLEDDKLIIMVNCVPALITFGEFLVYVFDGVNQLVSKHKLKKLCKKLDEVGVELTLDDFLRSCFKVMPGEASLKLTHILFKIEKQIIAKTADDIKFVDKDGKQIDMTDSVNSTFLSKRAYKKYETSKQNK